MKIQISGLSLLLLPLLGWSNPNTQRLPGTGDTYTVYKVDISEVEFEPVNSGNDNRWNLENKGGSPFVVEVKSAYEHPQFNHFKNADLVISNDFQGNSEFSSSQTHDVFYEISNQELIKLGRVDKDTVMQGTYMTFYGNKEVKMKDLIYEGFEHNDTWDAMYLDPFSGYNMNWENGETSYEVLGKGDLQISGVLIPNVFLIKRIRSYTASGSGVLDKVEDMTSYEWWHTDLSFPIATHVHRKSELKTDIYEAFYVDEAIIEPLSTYSNRKEEVLEFNIFPNPVRGPIKLNYYLENAGNVQIKLLDLSGKQIFSKQMSNMPGRHQFEINQNLSSGMYMVSITSGNSMINKKISIL